MQLLPHSDALNARAMERYMKNQFSFMGIKSELRRQLSQYVWRSDKRYKNIDVDFVRHCFSDDYREMLYVATDYLWVMKSYLQKEDLALLKQLILQNSWWDSVDALQRLVVHLPLTEEEINEEMLLWSKDKNLWLRRVSIIFQLSLKEKTNKTVLEKVIKNNIGSKAFFINKAIGWALRQYSKTNPEWVLSFIEENKEKLSTLSIREASKYL